jgi:hypothetical protein
VIAGVALATMLGSAVAQAAGPAADAGPATSVFVSVTPVYQPGADLEGGGDVKRTAVLLRGGAVTDLGGGRRAGITLVYDRLDYSFSNPTAFNLNAPWGVVQRYGASVPLLFAIESGWVFGATPSFEWFRENGARASDSLTWGATFSATRLFANGNMLGVGLAVFDRIEDTMVFPFLTIDWRLGDGWRVMNPLAAGPTGPAGIELERQFDNRWSAGVGAAWRSFRFRLSESGPTPNGIGEDRGVPVFLRVTHTFDKQSALHLYAGVVVNGQLRVENAGGQQLRQVDVDAAPLFGATFIARF